MADASLAPPALEDHVILLDEQGAACGTSPRATVHDTRTPLHLGFSCYLVREDGSVLLTRRALGKRTWPGVWTNSFCGHPRQGETLEQAVQRHAAHELGITDLDPAPVLPDFRYRAVDASGVVENEVCPVLTAPVTQAPRPNPDEVMEHRWVPREVIEQLAGTAPWLLSPWMVEQITALRHRPLLPGAAP